MTVDWRRWYDALRDHDPDIYRKTIEAIEGVTLANGVPQTQAAAYEVAAVLLVCDVLGVKP